MDEEVRRYPKRNVQKRDYEEPDEPEEDRYVFCDNCQESFLDCCPKCGQLAFLQDSPVEMGVENRAKLTLPSSSFIIKPSPIHGLGVFARVSLKRGMKMGPYEGKITRVESTSGYSWKLKNGQLVDAGDDKFSNWMRYVNCARHCKEQNLMAFQYKGELYYRTCLDIKPGEELLVYYGHSFANNLGINVKGYFKPDVEYVVESRKHCQFCYVVYKDASLLDNHIARCKSNPANILKVPERVFKCRFCYICVTDEIYLEKHEKRCGKGSQENKENIKRKDGRKYIAREKVNIVTKKNNRDKCHYITDVSANMNRHKSTHDQVIMFVCDICEKRFIRKENLQIHMNRHMDKAEETNVLKTTKISSGNGTKSIIMAKIGGSYVKVITFKCNMCKYVTSTSGNLQNHINHHLKKIMFECEFCSYVSTYKSTITTHINSIHTKEKTWNCVQCNYKSFNSSNLKEHIKSIHLKIRDHECGICGYTATQRSHLKSHLHAVHLKEKKYMCHICHFQTATKSNLDVHLNACHLKIKMYKCGFCSFFSYSNGNLWNHKKRKHFYNEET